MRRDGDKLLAAGTFKKGGEGFFFKGTNERWRDVVAHQDLDRYEAKVGATLSPECAHWVEQGRLRAGHLSPGAI